MVKLIKFENDESFYEVQLKKRIGSRYWTEFTFSLVSNYLEIESIFKYLFNSNECFHRSERLVGDLKSK